MRVVRREEHGAEAVRVDHGARARRVGREAVAGPALVLAELAAAAVEARVAPPHVDAEDGAPRGPVEPVLRALAKRVDINDCMSASFWSWKVPEALFIA